MIMLTIKFIFIPIRTFLNSEKMTKVDRNIIKYWWYVENPNSLRDYDGGGVFDNE